MTFLKHAFRTLVILLVIAALVGAAVHLVKQKRRKLSDAPKFGELPTPVRVVAVRRGDIEEVRNYLSVVEPIREATISARLTATVEEVLHDEGDAVAAGDTLLHLDGRQIKESIAAVEAQADQARADLAANEATVTALRASVAYWNREAGRDRTLVEKGAIPGSQAEGTSDKAAAALGKLDAAVKKSAALEHSTESLRARRDELQTTLGYCTLRSPFNGVVASRTVDPGDLAVPGRALMRVEDRNGLKLSFDIPQEDLPRVHEGLPVRFRVDDADRSAKLSHLYPSLNHARMLRGEVHLAGQERRGLTSGAFIPLAVVVRRIAAAAILPPSCIIDSPDHSPHVFALREGRLETRAVKIIARGGEQVAIEGVEPGEKVVQHTFLGWARLSSGLKVEAVE